VIDTHSLPEESFRQLARGPATPETVRLLAGAELSKHVALVRSLAGLAETRDHPHLPAIRSAYETLSEVRRVAPRAFSAVLGYPAVGAWALRTVLALRRGADRTARPERLAAVAAAAAIRGGVPARLTLPGTDVELPSLGAATLPGPASVQVHADGAEIIYAGTRVELPADPHTSVPGWRGLSVIAVPGKEFVLDDGDPYRFSFPATARTPLTAPAIAGWRARVQDGWRILDRDHPEVGAEVRETIVALIPMDAATGSLSSATAREAFGCVGMSLPDDARLVALTLAHEVQHAKLNALMDLFALTKAPTDDRFYAPWRDDPRPLIGLLHGTYAHLGVAGFWRRRRLVETDAVLALHAHTEFARWRQAAYESAGVVLRSGRLTDLGRLFVSALHDTLREWLDDEVPEPALSRARRQAARHHDGWLRGRR
jgi:HEXXH motif-containing protein